MNFQTFAFSICVLGLLGCSTAPRGSTTGAKSDQAAPGATNHTQKPVSIDQQAFNVIASTNQLLPQMLQTPTNFFKLGPGDLIDIELLGESTSRTSAAVGPDGKIYFGLLPGTFVWGLTLTEAKTVMDDGLQKFFREQPQIALTLRGVASQRVWILGQVQNPGVYPLATPLTLLEAIALASGTSGEILGTPGVAAGELANGTSEGTVNGTAGAAPGGTGGVVPSESDLKNSFVMREGKLLSVDFYRLLRKGDLSQNIYLQADDFVYLRPSGAPTVYVLGAVGRSGPVPFVDKISLLGVIASVGGTVPYAEFWEVAIIRGSLTNPSLATVNYRAIAKGQAPDVLLEPGDIVYVPFSPFKAIGELADRILKQFVSTIALNEGIHAVNANAPPVGISVGSVGTAPTR